MGMMIDHHRKAACELVLVLLGLPMLDRNKFHEQPRIEVPITIKLFRGVGHCSQMINKSQKEVVPVSHELRNAAKK